MLTNFEDQTYELTDSETTILPLVIAGFSRYTKENPIKEAEIIKRFNAHGYSVKLTGVRLRKLVNYIRSNSLLPLIATSKGYYISNDIEEITKQINSMQERANSIVMAANGLKKFIQ